MTEGDDRFAPRPEDASGMNGDEGSEATAIDGDAFPHPPWTVGLVLVAGVITLVFGILVNPIWLLVGSPFVIALALWLYVRLIVRPDANS